jgi:hypothetical protein
MTQGQLRRHEARALVCATYQISSGSTVSVNRRLSLHAAMSGEAFEASW